MAGGHLVAEGQADAGRLAWAVGASGVHERAGEEER